jgi:signal transduction histidine kinase
MSLFLDAPIEELKLSRRVRNALHHGGLHTLRSVLACDYRTTIRGFGPAARAELISALEAGGFALPSPLDPPDPDNTHDEIARLLGQMEESFQKWGARLEHFEMRLRALTARSPCQNEAPEQALACRALAQQFRTRLTNLRAITVSLQEVIQLPPEQHELIDLLEEQSVRLSVLVYHLFEMLAAEESLPDLPRTSSSASNAPERWTDRVPELAAGCKFLPAARGR